jgi:hypothetical protein
MKKFEKDIHIYITSEQIITTEHLKTYFPNAKMESSEEFEEFKTNVDIYDFEMDYAEFVNAIIKLAKFEVGFEIVVESDTNFFRETYKHKVGEDFITRGYIPEDFDINSGKDILRGITFHEKTEKIRIIK